MLLAALAAAATAAAAPTPDQIKACLATIGPPWTLEWRALTVGPPRAPRDPYEAMNVSGLGQPAPGPVYPVHVDYVLAGDGGRWPIVADYVVVRNAAGRWQIPALCTIP